MSSELSTQEKAFIRIWVAAIASLYVALGVLSVSIIAGEKHAADRDCARRGMADTNPG